jgi:hypothetical protein
MGLDLGTGSSFRGDPYGWLTNQCGHVLSGIAGAWLAALCGAPVWLIVVGAVAISIGIEVWQRLRQRGADGDDSIADVAFACWGALWQVTGGWWPPALVISIGLAAGTYLRARERT